MPCNPQVKICTHIKVTGIRCGSPALRGEKFCYFHQRMVVGVPTPKSSRIHPMALIESEEAIQSALMETINAIVRNQIDLRRADLIIKALNVAVKNSRRVRFDHCEDEMIRKLPESQQLETTTPVPPLKAAAPSVRTLHGWDEPKQKPEAPQTEALRIEVPRKPAARVTTATRVATARSQ